MQSASSTISLLDVVLPTRQSLHLSSASWATTTVPNSPTYNALGSQRFELRVHNWTQNTGGYQPIVASGMFSVELVPNADEIYVCDQADTLEGGGYCAALPIAGRSDFVIRGQRDVAKMRFDVEIWNADGRSYATASRTIAIASSRSSAGVLGFPTNWAVNTSCDLAYFRWYSTLLPLGSIPPHGTLGGDLGDWEFEGNGADSSGNDLSLAFAGQGPLYTPTPAYRPVANAGNSRTIRVGYSTELDATRSYSIR